MQVLRSFVIGAIASGIFAAAAVGQVVIDMPAPPVKPAAADAEPEDAAIPAPALAGYDTREEEAIFVNSGDIALYRYAGYRNLPRITTVPAVPFGSGYNSWVRTFDGPWIYPPIWSGFFFSHRGFHGPPVCLPGHGFHHFGGFHGKFRFGGDNFKGHIRIGF